MICRGGTVGNGPQAADTAPNAKMAQMATKLWSGFGLARIVSSRCLYSGSEMAEETAKQHTCSTEGFAGTITPQSQELLLEELCKQVLSLVKRVEVLEKVEHAKLSAVRQLLPRRKN